MERSRTHRLTALALLAALVLITAPAIQPLARADAADKVESAKPPTPADIQPDKLTEEPKGSQMEALWITGKIYKISSKDMYVGVLVQQKRAYKRFKLSVDDKSLIMVGDQPGNLDALSEGQEVEVGYVRKGKLEVVETLKVRPQ